MVYCEGSIYYVNMVHERVLFPLGHAGCNNPRILPLLGASQAAVCFFNLRCFFFFFCTVVVIVLQCVPPRFFVRTRGERGYFVIFQVVYYNTVLVGLRGTTIATYFCFVLEE